MSAEATGWVYRFSPFAGATFWVHHAIADSVNDQHENLFWMGQGRLARKARVSRRSAQRALDVLLGARFVELVEEGKEAGAPNLYRFLFPDVPVVYDSREIAKASEGVRHTDAPPGARGASPDRTRCATMTHRVRHRDAQTQVEPKRNPTNPPIAPPPDGVSPGGGGGGEEAFGTTSQTPASQDAIRDLLLGSGYGPEIVDQVLDELSFRLVSGKPLTAPGSWSKARANKLAEASIPSAPGAGATKDQARAPEACVHGTAAGEPCERCHDEAVRLRAGGWRALVTSPARHTDRRRREPRAGGPPRRGRT